MSLQSTITQERAAAPQRERGRRPDGSKQRWQSSVLSRVLLIALSLLFLVPPATAVEAHLLFGESLPLLSLAGVVVTTVGVALVLRPPGRRTAGRATMGA